MGATSVRAGALRWRREARRTSGWGGLVYVVPAPTAGVAINRQARHVSTRTGPTRRSLSNGNISPLLLRSPNVIRLAPIPLYTTYAELWQTVRALHEIVERGEHLEFSAERETVA